MHFSFIVRTSEVYYHNKYKRISHPALSLVGFLKNKIHVACHVSTLLAVCFQCILYCLSKVMGTWALKHFKKCLKSTVDILGAKE
jgi:hypothetical protein